MEENILDKIPKPEISNIRLLKVEKISIPHPYCIGSKHVEFASVHFNGMLGEEAIEEGEKQGIVCNICKNLNKKEGRIVLSYKEHKTYNTLFIEVSNNKDLNNINGLHEYLLSIKLVMDELKIDRVAFVMAKLS